MNLEVGRIYFDITYEDDEMQYPIVHSYEYVGFSAHAGSHKFRCLGSKDSYTVKEDELEFISSTAEVITLLQEWAQRNSTLSS